MGNKFIVTNFSYGTGPFLRTTNLALSFNEELKKAGREKMKIIVPLVYGERQRQAMAEEFGVREEIILDEKLGKFLLDNFYADSIYQESLKKWVENHKASSKKAREHLISTYGKNIEVELSRAPRIRYDICPAYYTSFAFISEILRRAGEEKEINLDKKLLQKGVEAAEWVERNYRMHAIAYPATFSYLEKYTPKYRTEILTPPIAPLPPENHDLIYPGIFVTITGIPGLERLYADAKRLGYKLYSNISDAVPESIRALPHVISNKNVLFQFARSGWSSIWISMIVGTPLVVPNFDPDDDPEIFFNNRSLEKLQLGVVFRGQSLEEILKDVPRVKKAYDKMNYEILNRWGTLDGNQYCAELFANDFLNI
ncbi:hypothetical protein A3B18_02775 [Candidatus Giovannonibacteria bacterium RIFCSPLOWO2_01_FULL_46_13]|uniref:Glycosyltransferase n=1 Tax=Candidatus Giovannonibacteria bacterium RIFCSPLOWO2_01_FULL_46_13 TaxID=1798352 RepID=A0A1F5X2T5_9BACT|nr:MAG: hypothetical protein A3B18_02775 [Candidatus Giovannonibacteria bacterium RIFCSPLOWO2_01_FULL_46_13]